MDIVSRGGNLLLNVGPTADGRIPVIMQQRLVDMGEWLKVNGDAIYGTRKRDISSQESGDQKLYFTSKTGSVFCMFSPAGKDLTIDLLDSEKVSQVSLLGWKGDIQWGTKGQQLIIELPKIELNEIPCLYTWTLQIDLQ